MYRVRVIRRWRLATRWWGPSEAGQTATSSASSPRTSKSSSCTMRPRPPPRFPTTSAGYSIYARA